MPLNYLFENLFLLFLKKNEMNLKNSTFIMKLITSGFKNIVKKAINFTKYLSSVIKNKQLQFFNQLFYESIQRKRGAYKKN